MGSWLQEHLWEERLTQRFQNFRSNLIFGADELSWHQSQECFSPPWWLMFSQVPQLYTRGSGNLTRVHLNGWLGNTHWFGLGSTNGYQKYQWLGMGSTNGYPSSARAQPNAGSTAKYRVPTAILSSILMSLSSTAPQYAHTAKYKCLKKHPLLRWEPGVSGNDF